MSHNRYIVKCKSLEDHLLDVEFYIQRTVSSPDDDRKIEVNIDSDELKEDRKTLRESMVLALKLMDELGL